MSDHALLYLMIVMRTWATRHKYGWPIDVLTKQSCLKYIQEVWVKR